MQYRINVYDKGMHKQRVTVTVDEELVEAANRAVSEGLARSVSEWVSEAMAQRHDRDARLAVMRRLLEEYEADHGVISEEEIAEQAQQDRDAAGSYRAELQQAG